jgi:SAM-dependent methyltransferase
MATIAEQRADEAALHAVVRRGIEEAGAALQAALVVMGDRLGLYGGLADAGPLTAGQLAARTGAAEPYVRDWLNAQAAGGHVAYEPDTGRYSLPPQEAAAFADAASPYSLLGLFELALGVAVDASRVVLAATAGAGLALCEHAPEVRDGRDRFVRAACAAHLLTTWLPSLGGALPKLERGAEVVDVGCGQGGATILLAQAFPRSRCRGFDTDPDAIASARERAAAAGVDSRCAFEVAGGAAYSGSGYDLVTMFDCLHDLGDPAGAARHVRSALAPDGTWLIVEPRAGDRVEENLNPVGRAYYGLSTLLCTPASLAQEGGLALGAQAGEARIRELVLGAGFSTFRRVAETPLHMVFEARP